MGVSFIKTCSNEIQRYCREAKGTTIRQTTRKEEQKEKDPETHTQKSRDYTTSCAQHTANGFIYHIIVFLAFPDTTS